MKLIVAIVQDQDAQAVAKKLVDNDVRATKLASTGGFLRAGNTTFLIGIDEEKVAFVLDLIKSCSKKRDQLLTTPLNIDSPAEGAGAYPLEVQAGGAAVFVLPVDEFHHF